MDYTIREQLEKIIGLLRDINEKLDKLINEKEKTDELPF